MSYLCGLSSTSIKNLNLIFNKIKKQTEDQYQLSWKLVDWKMRSSYVLGNIYSTERRGLNALKIFLYLILSPRIILKFDINSTKAITVHFFRIIFRRYNKI